MRRIILPQAMRVIIPPMGNETISMLKTTSLVAVISGRELMTNITIAYSQNFKIMPLLIVACIWYIFFTTLLTIGQHYLERYFGKGFGDKETAVGGEEGPEAAASRREATSMSPETSELRPSALDSATTPASRGSRWSRPSRCGSPSASSTCSRASTSWSSRGRRSSCSGPSGGGKSTLLRCINHLEKIDAGRLWVDGELMGYRQKGDVLHEMHPRDVSRQRAKIGMVFQRFNLFPHLTAIENVMEAPIRVKKTDKKQAEAEAEKLAVPRSGSRRSSTSTRRSSPAASSSGSPSPAPWP